MHEESAVWFDIVKNVIRETGVELLPDMRGPIDVKGPLDESVILDNKLPHELDVDPNIMMAISIKIAKSAINKTDLQAFFYKEKITAVAMWKVIDIEAYERPTSFLDPITFKEIPFSTEEADKFMLNSKSCIVRAHFEKAPE